MNEEQANINRQQRRELAKRIAVQTVGQVKMPPTGTPMGPEERQEMDDSVKVWSSRARNLAKIFLADLDKDDIVPETIPVGTEQEVKSTSKKKIGAKARE